jgi:hypothetical protein
MIFFPQGENQPILPEGGQISRGMFEGFTREGILLLRKLKIFLLRQF